jgi:NTE family protein
MTFLDNADEAERQNTRTGLRRVLNLALQGGGSHGAFAWGVLDRLLEEEIFRGYLGNERQSR